MRLARFLTPLLIFPILLINPTLFSAMWPVQPVGEVAALSVSDSPALIDAATNGKTLQLASSVSFAQPASPTALPANPQLDSFVATVKNGEASQVVGVYVSGVLALRIYQQPKNDPAYVSAAAGYATQFRLAADYGSIGLLAHNYLAGALFFKLSVGQEVDVVYGNGVVKRYTVFALRHFQALRPTDPTSNFVDIDNNQGTQISNSDVFYQVYGGNRVVFQTCINRDGNASWGRLFVIAVPLS